MNDSASRRARAPLAAYAETWRPYRSYAVQHLWATSDHPINRMPH